MGSPRPLRKPAMWPKFCVCCPLLTVIGHCNLSSALSGLFLPFSLLSSFFSFPFNERIHPTGCGCFLCDGQQRVSSGLGGARPREGNWPWGDTVPVAQPGQGEADQRLGLHQSLFSLGPEHLLWAHQLHWPGHVDRCSLCVTAQTLWFTWNPIRDLWFLIKFRGTKF